MAAASSTTWRTLAAARTCGSSSSISRRFRPRAQPNHLGAAARLLRDQKRRSLIVWITDAPDVAMLPDVVAAAAQLRPRHLVLFVVVGDPDLDRLIRLRPQDLDEMYRVAAAQEVAHRRELLLARVRASGALTIESTAGLSPRS